jgi:hypothetical protein
MARWSKGFRKRLIGVAMECLFYRIINIFGRFYPKIEIKFCVETEKALQVFRNRKRKNFRNY